EVVPSFDLHCPLMSLPLALGTTMQSIPGNVPYLRAEPARVEKWQTRLGPRDGHRRVGLCWAGSAEHADDRDRSITLAQFAPLARDGVTFFSLQKGPPAMQCDDPP